MISLEKARSKLDIDCLKYTDEQIIEIRDFCYKRAEIEYVEYLHTMKSSSDTSKQNESEAKV